MAMAVAMVKSQRLVTATIVGGMAARAVVAVVVAATTPFSSTATCFNVDVFHDFLSLFIVARIRAAPWMPTTISRRVFTFMFFCYHYITPEYTVSGLGA